MRAQDLIYSYSLKKDGLTFRAKNGSAKISLNKVNEPEEVNLYYNINNTTWNIYTIGDEINLSENDEVSFKGTQSTFSLDETNYYRFAMTGTIQSYGNVMSLVNEAKNITNTYQFNNLFSNCSGLLTPPDLPATILSDYCYRNMFQNCKSLITIPTLPATTLASFCYLKMFGGCTSLTIIPTLPATTLNTGCYQSMFQNCTSITQLPYQLPATNLKYKCYWDMFHGCTALTSIPANFLPATTLASMCYATMFTNCTSLSSVPSGLLPATTLAERCYQSMFEGCRNLTNLPALPAHIMASFCYYATFKYCYALTEIPQNYLPSNIKLADNCFFTMFANDTSLSSVPSGLLSAKKLATNCYKRMFDGCSSLVDAPLLPAVTLNGSCYQGMFLNCTSLTSMNVSFKNWSPSTATQNWVSGVITQNGQFTKVDYLTETYGDSYIPINWNIISKEEEISQNLSFRSIGATTIRLNKVGSPNTATVQYSKNNEEWTDYTFGTSISLADGDIISFTGENESFSKDKSNYYQFVFNGTGTISGFGNVMSLLDFNDTCTSGCFTNLFGNCSKLVTAPDLPAIELADQCYDSMFEGCTSLTSVPALPAFDLAKNCYSQMFKDCTSLTSVPSNLLPATILVEGCYNTMFMGCTALTSVPNLNATTLVKNCYNTMFRDCTALISVPSSLLPATTLADGCYYTMFYGCTSLTTTPNLPATVLADNCYDGMFVFCSSLVNIPSTLPATILTDYCYRGMFYGCTSLTTTPTLPATTLADNCYDQMFARCSSITTPPVLPAIELAPNCYAQMFQYCTILTSAPELPATTLASACYQTMFWNCTSLTSAPVLSTTTLAPNCYREMFMGCSGILDAPQLPATTLADGCYNSMFRNCSNLSSVHVSFTDWSDELQPTQNWLSGVAPTGKFYKPDDLQILISENNIPVNWEIDDIEGNEVVNDFYTPLTFTAIDDATIVLSTIGSPSAVNLQYNVNNTGWTTYTINDPISLNANDTIAFSGANDHFSKDATNYYNFIMTGRVSSSGNMNSVINFNQNINSKYCYFQLFYQCSSLVSAPRLPSRTISEGCYRAMFDRCTSLTAAPYLPYFTTIATNCFRAMFSHCTSLTEMANMNWHDCAPSCCCYMYEFCSGLTGTITLPATGLATACYKGMFTDCTNITDVKLSATSINYSECCNNMFLNNCPRLSSIEVNFTEWYGNNSTGAWVKGVANNGIFYADSSLPVIKGTSNIPINWVIENTDQLVDENPLTFTATENAAIALRSVGSPSAISLQYKINNNDWTIYNIGDPIYLNTNDTVAFSGVNDHFSKDDSNYYNFMMTGRVASSGNIQSLVNFNKNITNNHAYKSLFANCSGLLNAPSLYCKTLLQSCYKSMFQNCTSLTAANTFPLLLYQVQSNCCNSMFEGCSSLVVPPDINGSQTFVVSNYAFKNMFARCTSLQTPPALNFTINSNMWGERIFMDMFHDCYSLTAVTLPSGTGPAGSESFMNMYRWCTSLTTVPILDFNLTYGCYYGMFAGCTSLSSVPQYMLPGGNLQPNCYNQMFSGCINLREAPLLPVPVLTGYCYANMFAGCSNLTSINVGFQDWYDDMSATYNWVSGVAPTGEFTKPNNLSTEYGANRIPIDWTITGAGEQQGMDTTGMFTMVSKGGAGMRSVKLNKVGSPNANTFKYVVDNGTEWVDYIIGDTINFYDYIAFSGTTINFSKNLTNYYRFALTGNVELTGNISSLVNGNTDVSNYMFTNIFSGCAGIVDASGLILPANTMANCCYYQMFSYCTTLITPPELPAMDTAPSCYYAMFDRCSSLKTPPQLPASSMTDGCYWALFRNCFALTSFPELSATVMAPNCYRGIFEKCTTVKDAPQLPLATLATDCYRFMYNGCSSLSSINVNFTTWGYCTNWVAGVKNTNACIFTKPSGLATTRGNNNIPSNWTINNK